MKRMSSREEGIRESGAIPKWLHLPLVVVIILVALLFMTGTSSVQAQDSPTPAPTPTPLSNVSADENCRMCHTDHNFKGRFRNGDFIYLYVDSGEFENSVHGPAGLECIACHTHTKRYPHEAGGKQIDCMTCHPEEGGTSDTPDVALMVDLPYDDQRDMTLSINNACSSCHKEEFKISTDSIHVKVQQGGNRYAPVCVDCHGSHDISNPDQPRAKISRICGDCHRAVYSTYSASIHGAALKENSNPDVPTCVDCHGVHKVRGPHDTSFRNDSIAICGGCHADEKLMDKYGISTAVFQTYLSDFHGRSVNLFRREDAGRSGDEAVCFDCHGTHNILPPDDPRSSIYPTNLQATCQQCHEDASIRFPQAWLSHYVPTLEQTPFLYLVNIAYGYLLIPGVIGGFLVYIGLDARKRWSEKREKLRKAIAKAEEELEEELGSDNDFHPES